MNWIPLRILAVPVMLLLAIVSLAVLVRGHNEPGGGFIGGLLGASGVLVYALAHDAAAARRLLRVSPPVVLGLGVLAATAAGLVGLLHGQAFLTAQWWGAVPGVGKVGTVLLFDSGVYLVVFGATVQVMLDLLEASTRRETS